MTLHDVATQVHRLSRGRINGERFTYAQLKANIATWCRIGNGRYIGSIVLPDGEWLYELTSGDFGYDYYIPDTREQENALYDALNLPHNYFCHVS